MSTVFFYSIFLNKTCMDGCGACSVQFSTTKYLIKINPKYRHRCRWSITKPTNKRHWQRLNLNWIQMKLKTDKSCSSSVNQVPNDVGDYNDGRHSNNEYNTENNDIVCMMLACCKSRYIVVKTEQTHKTNEVTKLASE